jgi:hypothetical protein
MVDWLLRLKMYLAILQEEGDLTGTLSEDKWKIATDLKSLLTEAVRRESYVTISIVPFMIYKIRKDLTMVVQD